MSRACAEPVVVLDRADAVPLTTQIAGQLREAIRRGRIGAGERVPSTRVLAATLAVSRTVVTNAYAQLYAEGWLEGRHGSGSYAAAGAATGTAAGAATGTGARAVPGSRAGPGAGAGAAPVSAGSTPAGDPAVIDLRPGIPWSAGISEAAWRRAWRQAGSVPPSAAPTPDPRGSPALHQALAGYLRRMRAVTVQPGQIMITRGVANSLDMLFAALLRPGDRVGIEEPGYPVARDIAVARGLTPVPCPVDEHGLAVDRLPQGLRLVYTTPAHQYPLGGRLPVPRRRALLAWASRAGACIVEDDFDSEFRYDVAPLPALYGLGPEGRGVVAYLGTTAKTLTPELNVGWLVAREDIVDAVARTRLALGDRTPVAAQHAVGALIADGELERHIRRMRLEYARRRAAIVAALAGLPPPARLLGDTAGMHVLLRLPAEVVPPAMDEAGRRGIALMALDRYFGGPATAHGLVLGYGGATLGQVVTASRTLREILAPMLARRRAEPAPRAAPRPSRAGNPPGAREPRSPQATMAR
jgi:GntR family transcriptional regulator/MocR family aminotransferase